MLPYNLFTYFSFKALLYYHGNNVITFMFLWYKHFYRVDSVLNSWFNLYVYPVDTYNKIELQLNKLNWKKFDELRKSTNRKDQLKGLSLV